MRTDFHLLFISTLGISTMVKDKETEVNKLSSINGWEMKEPGSKPKSVWVLGWAWHLCHIAQDCCYQFSPSPHPWLLWQQIRGWWLEKQGRPQVSKWHQPEDMGHEEVFGGSASSSVRQLSTPGSKGVPSPPHLSFCSTSVAKGTRKPSKQERNIRDLGNFLISLCMCVCKEVFTDLFDCQVLIAACGI